MHRLAFATAALFAATSLPALAEEAQCFQNDQFLVIAQERSEDVGTDILVREPAKGKIACVYAEQPGDYVVNPDGEPLWYEGLMGKYLVMTRSTGPDGNLVIRDLETQDLVLDEWVDDDVVLSSTEVTFWQRFEDGNADTCPEYAEYTANGLGAVIAHEQVFDSERGTITATGAERCSATQ